MSYRTLQQVSNECFQYLKEKKKKTKPNPNLLHLMNSDMKTP